jgi:hypothetical protein
VLPTPQSLPEPAPPDSTPPPGPAVPASNPRSGPSVRSRPAGEFAGMTDSPEMQEFRNLRARGALDTRYAALFKMLGLPAGQLQQLQQLLLDKQGTVSDVVIAMRTQGLAPGRENADQMQALVQNANAEIEAQIRMTLGDAAYARYQQYEATQVERSTVDRVRQRLSYSGEPLSDQQANRLVEIMAQGQPGEATTPNDLLPARRLRTGLGLDTAAITSEVYTQAQAILSPSQMPALAELQREQQAQAQLSRSRRNLGTTGAAPTSPR